MNRPYSHQALMQVFKRVGAARKGGRWTLASGRESDFYVDVRKVTTDPIGAVLVADGLFGPLMDVVSRAVTQGGGPVYVVTGGVGGGLLLGALLAWAGGQDIPHVRGIFVRDAAKGHGTDKLVEGDLPPEGRRGAAIIIDDVLTTGDSVRRFADAVKDRLDVQTVAVVVDRQEGGAESLCDDFHVVYLLRRADLEPGAAQEESPEKQPEVKKDEQPEGDQDTPDGPQAQADAGGGPDGPRPG